MSHKYLSTYFLWELTLPGMKIGPERSHFINGGRVEILSRDRRLEYSRR